MWFSIVVPASALQPAFPGAEGFGAYALGGRSGTVYHVTNLSDSGTGSLRDAVSQPNRTIVFDVSGTINMSSRLNINKPNLTVAGQTAPGDGITLKGWMTSVQDTHDVIVRYIRFRAGDINCPDFQDDSFHFDNCQNVIADHVSASWSEDEAFSVTWSDNATVQWSMITEPLNFSCRDEGSGIENHGYGSLLRYGSGGLSFHHNLYAHSWSRNPRLGDSIRLDWVNNVIYNWSSQAGYNANDGAQTQYLNYINSYLIGGTNTDVGTKIGRAFNSSVSDPSYCQIYQSGNLMDTNRNGVLDSVDRGWAAFQGTFSTNASRFASPQVSTDGATTAYVRVLSSAGASVARDAVDARIVSNVVDQTGAIINSQSEVGGWPTLNSLPAPLDTDQDGMPDFWEAALGSSTNNAADQNNLTPDGYTRLEGYLNWLASPHARVTNSFVSVDLQQYTAGVQSPTYTVSSAANGVVAVLGDGHTAQFAPTAGFSGLASFVFVADGSPASLTGTVSLLVTPYTPVWRGDGTANNWDTTTANWLNGSTPVTFAAGDNVIFNDAGSNTPSINLVGTLLPASVTVTAAQDYTFGGAGSLAGAMSLVKSGAGQLTVTTSNTYSGGTTVSGGTLLVNSPTGSGTGSGAVTVNSGATLGGNGVVAGPVTANGTLAPGNNGVGTFTINHDLTVNSGALLPYALGTSSDRTAVSGNLTLGGTLSITDAGGFTSNTYTLFTYGGTLTLTSLSLSAAPAGYGYAISLATPGQVNLVVTAASSEYQQWQIAYFGSTLNLAGGPTADPDGDGMNNQAEFQAGTDPTNSASAFRITSIVRQGTNMVINWRTGSDRTNALQATTGGSYTTNTFADISDLIIIPSNGVDVVTNYVDVGGTTNTPSRYYRIRLVP